MMMKKVFMGPKHELEKESFCFTYWDMAAKIGSKIGSRRWRRSNEYRKSMRKTNEIAGRKNSPSTSIFFTKSSLTLLLLLLLLCKFLHEWKRNVWISSACLFLQSGTKSLKGLLRDTFLHQHIFPFFVPFLMVCICSQRSKFSHIMYYFFFRSVFRHKRW